MVAWLGKTIGYPQEVPAEAEVFDFVVDGESIRVSLVDGSAAQKGVALVFQTVLTEDEEVAGRLAAYAAGRLLKESATLAWDPEKRAAILWEKFEGFEGFERFEGTLKRDFESFCESADWWRARVKEQSQGPAGVAEMMIRP